MVLGRIGHKRNGSLPVRDTVIKLADAGKNDAEHVVGISKIRIKLQGLLYMLDGFVGLSDLQLARRRKNPWSAPPGRPLRAGPAGSTHPTGYTAASDARARPADWCVIFLPLILARH